MYLQEPSWLPLLLPGWWFGTFFIFHILGIVTPTDYFSGGLKPPTRLLMITIYITITAPMSVTLTWLLHCYHHCSDFYCHHEYHHGCFRTMVDVVYRDVSGVIIHTCMYILFTIDFVYIYIWCTHTYITIYIHICERKFCFAIAGKALQLWESYSSVPHPVRLRAADSTGNVQGFNLEDHPRFFFLS